MSKNTPGPWYFPEESNTYGGIFITTKAPWSMSGSSKWDQTIVEVMPDGMNTKEQMANAKLIAAAPDLLSALKDCVRFFDNIHNALAANELTSLNEYKEVIAKAEGRL